MRQTTRSVLWMERHARVMRPQSRNGIEIAAASAQADTTASKRTAARRAAAKEEAEAIESTLVGLRAEVDSLLETQKMRCDEAESERTEQVAAEVTDAQARLERVE